MGSFRSFCHLVFEFVSNFGFRPARPCLFGHSASTASSSEAGANKRHNANRAMAGGYSDFA